MTEIIRKKHTGETTANPGQFGSAPKLEATSDAGLAGASNIAEQVEAALSEQREAIADAQMGHHWNKVTGLCSCGLEVGLVCDGMTREQHISDIARTFTTGAKEPEPSAHIVQHGDPEPDLLPYQDYVGSEGRIWARQVLGGCRWRGECRWSIPWEELPLEIFPLTEIIEE